jgi:hypothetical protein
MIVQIKIPDSTYETYLKHSPTNPERAMEQQLIRFAEIRPSERILLLPPKERDELEVMLDSNFATARELVAKVRELLGIRVEGVDVTLDPNTLMRLVHQAEFEGVAKEQFLRDRIGDGLRFAIDGGL